MYYRFIKEYSATGYLWQPIYDDAPSYGKFRRDICHKFIAGDLFLAIPFIDEVGIEWNDTYEIDSDDGLCVSMYGGTRAIKLPIDELVKNGVMIELSEEEFYHIKEIRDNIKKAEKALSAITQKINVLDCVVDDLFQPELLELNSSIDDAIKANDESIDIFINEWIHAAGELACSRIAAI